MSSEQTIPVDPQEIVKEPSAPQEVVPEPSPEAIIEESPQKIVEEPSSQEVSPEPSPQEIVEESPQENVAEPSPQEIVKESPQETVANPSPPEEITKEPSREIVENPSPPEVIPEPSPQETIEKPSPQENVAAASPPQEIIEKPASPKEEINQVVSLTDEEVTPTPKEDAEEIAQPTISINKEEIGKTARAAVSTLERFYRVTKERVLEKMGKAKPSSVDPELQAKIEKMESSKDNYDKVLALQKKYCDQFANITETARQLSVAMKETGEKENDATSPLFDLVGESYRTIHRHGEELVPQLDKFFANMDTYRHKALEDTLETMNKYSSSRVEYDAYQSKYEQMETEKKRSPEAIEEARQEAEKYKEKFERLGKDVAEKIELLYGMREREMISQVEVLTQSLLKFHQESTSGLQQVLDKSQAKAI